MLEIKYIQKVKDQHKNRSNLFSATVPKIDASRWLLFKISHTQFKINRTHLENYENLIGSPGRSTEMNY